MNNIEYIEYIEYDYETMDVLLGFKDNFDYNKVIFDTKKIYNYEIKKIIKLSSIIIK